MRKANIFVREEDVAQLVVALARLEILDVAQSEARAGWSGNEAERWSELADTYADQVRRLEQLLELLKIPRQEVSPLDQVEPDRDASAIEESLQEAETVVQAWQARRTETEEEIEQIGLLLESIRLLEPLDVSVEAMRNLHHLYLTVGTLPKENLQNLEIVLFRIPFVIIPIYEFDDRVLIFAATDQDHTPILNRALNSIFMELLELPQELTGSPAQVADLLHQRLTEAKRELAALEEEREQLVQKWRAQLLALWFQARSDRTVVETIDRLSRQGELYLISGWVPEQAVDELLITVQNVTGGRADVEVLEPIAGGADVPSLVQNPAFLRPFENLVSTFGFPAYDEIDPTPLVALTFVLMYGSMFGDVGHGLLLALAGLWLWWRGRGQGASLGVVLAVSGLSGALFGFLYGALFGREDILPHLWLNPLESIGTILLVSVAAGVVLLNVGFGLHLISAWRSEAWGQLLFSRRGLAGIWLYWVLVGGILVLWQGLALSFSLWLLLVVIPALLIFLHEPLGRLATGERPLLDQSWGDYSIPAFFELFEALLSYFSNSLSFVRLGAFAVAHAGLSQVVFALADLAGSSGWQWVVIVLGTLFIVGFEGLVVGIQTLRLEYHEFFGKFFGGQGSVFAPLRLSTKVEPG